MHEKFRLILDSVSYEIERQEDMLLVNGHPFSYDIRDNIVYIDENPHTVSMLGSQLKINDKLYPVEVEGLDEPILKKRRVPSLSTGADAGVLSAAMPGLIVKLFKKEGDRVKAGDVLIILEAMKMQNELQARIDGFVKRILVKEGESVEMRQVLIEIEPDMEMGTI